MRALLERVNDGEVLVADGAIGSLLMQRGLGAGQCPESVNLSSPEVLEEIAAQYLAAGAEIVQTNTLGASPAKLAVYDLASRAEEINQVAVQAVRRALGDRAYVSGSCGPSGKILKPYGDADPDELYQSFRTQMASLIGAGVDVLCVETMIDPAEAALAVKAAKDVSAGVPVMATMTFDATPKGFFTIMGTSVDQAAAALGQAGADLVGSNCGNGIEPMVRIARAFKDATDLPLIIQSNAGLPQIVEGSLRYGESPEFMADRSRELLSIGVSIIGGCCGTTPEHTRALRTLVDQVSDR
jgi:5-methyltetrahydrofolate--homocysteine methyltransferase